MLLTLLFPLTVILLFFGSAEGAGGGVEEADDASSGYEGDSG